MILHSIPTVARGTYGEPGESAILIRAAILNYDLPPLTDRGLVPMRGAKYITRVLREERGPGVRFVGHRALEIIARKWVKRRKKGHPITLRLNHPPEEGIYPNLGAFLYAAVVAREEKALLRFPHCYEKLEARLRHSEFDSGWEVVYSDELLMYSENRVYYVHQHSKHIPVLTKFCDLRNKLSYTRRSWRY